MDELAQFVKKCDPKHSRKRPRDPSSWKREVERKKRYVKLCHYCVQTSSKKVLCKMHPAHSKLGI